MYLCVCVADTSAQATKERRKELEAERLENILREKAEDRAEFLTKKAAREARLKKKHHLIKGAYQDHLKVCARLRPCPAPIPPEAVARTSRHRCHHAHGMRAVTHASHAHIFT